MTDIEREWARSDRLWRRYTRERLAQERRHARRESARSGVLNAVIGALLGGTVVFVVAVAVEIYG